MTARCVLPLAVALVAAGCAQNPVQPDPGKHIGPAEPAASRSVAPIPQPVAQSFALPRPRAVPKADTHSVVVHNVAVRDLLFALARDARINIDIHPGITGTVTLNALDQTLPQLLDRIARQADIRWELQGDALTVMPDAPFLRHYKVDYVNMARDTQGTVSVTTEISTAGAAPGSTQGGAAGGNVGGNGSQTVVGSVARNRFWDTLIANVKDLLRETDKVLEADVVSAPAAAPAGAQATPAEEAPQAGAAPARERRVSYREAASVIANPESGIVSVRATARQHERVQEFFDRVLDSARRQVLIEATIAEVELSQNYQQGVDWSKLDLSGTGFRLVQKAAGSLTAPPASLIELGFTSSGGSFSGSVKLLESFGTVKVLSSPKISVLNNQTAVLKVVDNSVYFTVDVNIQRGNGTNQNDLTTYNTKVHTVPIGLVLNVTPQIGDNANVILNVRPSLSRIVGTVTDPNPVLKELGITNAVPVVRSREMDSVIRVEDGNVAVMGGLMEDAIDLNKDTVPAAASLPLIGSLFQNRNDTRRKSELVILMRPTIVRQASLSGDYSGQRSALPGDDFFRGEAGPSLLGVERLTPATRP